MVGREEDGAVKRRRREPEGGRHFSGVGALVPHSLPEPRFLSPGDAARGGGRNGGENWGTWERLEDELAATYVVRRPRFLLEIMRGGCCSYDSIGSFMGSVCGRGAGPTVAPVPREPLDRGHRTPRASPCPRLIFFLRSPSLFSRVHARGWPHSSSSSFRSRRRHGCARHHARSLRHGRAR